MTAMQKRSRTPASDWRTGVIVCLVAMAAFWATDWLDSKAVDPGDVMLLYIGAEDCAPCRAWQGRDGAAFRSSAEFSRINYREVRSMSVFDVLKDENWPDDLRSYRDRLGREAAVPMWL